MRIVTRAGVVALASAAVALGGCAEDETAIYLSICSNVREDLADELLIEVIKGDVVADRSLQVGDIDLARAPYAISLRPGRQIDGVIEIAASLWNDRSLVVERRIKTSFTPEVDRDVGVWLDSSCVDVRCDGDLTCEKGTCEQIREGAGDACGSSDVDGGVGCENPDMDGDEYPSIACGGTDCDDDVFEVHPDAPELCDLIDNDCSGGADDGLWVAGPETYASYAFTDERTPSIAYGADAYGVAWRATRECATTEDCDGLPCVSNMCQDLEELRFVPFNSIEGTPPTENQLVLSGDVPLVGAPSVTWSGVDWAIAYEDATSGPLAIYFARVDNAGRALGNPVELSSPDGDGAFAPGLAFGHRTYGVVFSEVIGGDAVLRYMQVDTTGRSLAAAQISQDGDDAGAGVLAPGDDQFGIAWISSDGVVWFRIVSEQAVPDGDPVQVSGGGDTFVGFSADVLWTGEDWIVVWEQFADGFSQIFLSRLDAQGVALGAPTQIVQTGQTALSPALASSGADIALVWSDGEEGDQRVLLQRLTLRGEPQGPPIRMIRAEEARGSRPAVTWNDDTFEWGVVWQDERLANDTDVWFNRLYCEDGV